MWTLEGQLWLQFRPTLLLTFKRMSHETPRFDTHGTRVKRMSFWLRSALEPGLRWLLLPELSIGLPSHHLVPTWLWCLVAWSGRTTKLSNASCNSTCPLIQLVCSMFFLFPCTSIQSWLWVGCSVGRTSISGDIPWLQRMKRGPVCSQRGEQHLQRADGLDAGAACTVSHVVVFPTKEPTYHLADNMWI